MAMAERYPTAPAHAAPPAATPHQTPPEAVTLTSQAAMDMVQDLLTDMGREDPQDFKSTSAEYTYLLRRAEALCALLRPLVEYFRAWEAAHPPKPAPAYQKPELTGPALRERLSVIVVEDDTVGVVPTDADLWDYVYHLQRAVADYPLPAGWQFTEEAAEALYRFARLADALETATHSTAMFISERARAEQRVRELAGLAAPAGASEPEKNTEKGG